MKRLLLLSVLFSLLLAISQPLSACGMDMSSHDCCPAGTHDPCDDDAGTLPGICPDMNACGTAGDVPVILVQAQHKPDPAAAGVTTGADPPACPVAGHDRPPISAPLASNPHPDHVAVSAALTWLRTARLRR